MRPMSPIRCKQSGFTVVELLVSLTLSAVVIVVFVSLLFSGLLSTRADAIKSRLTNDLQIALNQLERDVRYSSTFHTSLPSQFSDAQAPGGGWTHRGSANNPNDRVLLLSSNATSNNPFSAEREQVYENDEEYNCSPTPPSGSLYLNPAIRFMTIYFVGNDTLYRRIVTDSVTPRCNDADIYQKQSCPSGEGDGCTVKDEVVVQNVSEFRIDYLIQQDNPQPFFETINTAYNQPNPGPINEASMIKITLELLDETNNNTTRSKMDLTVNRINT